MQNALDERVEAFVDNNYHVPIGVFMEECKKWKTLPGDPEHAFSRRIGSYLRDRKTMEKWRKIQLLRSRYGLERGTLPDEVARLGIPPDCIIDTRIGGRSNEEKLRSIAAGRFVPSYSLIYQLALDFGVEPDQRYDFITEGIRNLMESRTRQIGAQKTDLPEEPAGKEDGKRKELAVTMKALMATRSYSSRGQPIRMDSEGIPISHDYLTGTLNLRTGVLRLLRGESIQPGDRDLVGSFLDAMQAKPDESKPILAAFEAAYKEAFGAPAAPPASASGTFSGNVNSGKRSGARKGSHIAGS